MDAKNESKSSMVEREPAWIRDAQAAVIDIDTSRPDQIGRLIAEICEGEKNYCEHCGAELPMWPVKLWADHVLTAHHDRITVQYRTGTALLCEDELNQGQQMYFSMMFSVRVTMRRRAWKLGYAVVKPGAIKLVDA